MHFEYVNEDNSLSFEGEYCQMPVGTEYLTVFTEVRVYSWCKRAQDWTRLDPSPAFEAFESYEDRVLDHIAYQESIAYEQWAENFMEMM